VKRDGFVVHTKTSRFTERVVSLAQKAVVGLPAPAYRPGEEGYADWVILAVQGLKEYLGHPYRKLMDVLREMPRVTKSLGLTPETVPLLDRMYTKADDSDEAVACDPRSVRRAV